MIWEHGQLELKKFDWKKKNSKYIEYYYTIGSINEA